MNIFESEHLKNLVLKNLNVFIIYTFFKSIHFFNLNIFQIWIFSNLNILKIWTFYKREHFIIFWKKEKKEKEKNQTKNKPDWKLPEASQNQENRGDRKIYGPAHLHTICARRYADAPNARSTRDIGAPTLAPRRVPFASASVSKWDRPYRFSSIVL